MIFQTKNSKKFRWRTYISVGLAISFIFMSFSGALLYLAPPGRVARWTEWISLGLSIEQWQAQHTLSSFLFLVLGIIHLFFMNWRVFFSYIKKKAIDRFSYRREVSLALATFFIFFFFTLYRIPPIISIMDLGDNISDSWAEKISDPPIPHTEELSINDIALDILSISPEQLISIIEQHGYEVNSSMQTLNAVAESNNTSPSAIFDKISVGLNVYRLKK